MLCENETVSVCDCTGIQTGLCLLLAGQLTSNSCADRSLGYWLISFMDGDNKKNSVELEASLAPAEAEVGAVAKADQKYLEFSK